MNNKSQNLTMKVAFLFSILGFLAYAVNPVMALRDMSFNGSVRQSPVANDEFANAQEVSLEYRSGEITPFVATENPVTDLPSSACNLASGLATVWYKHTPTVDEKVHMDSIGSSYDTFMVLYTYDGASLTEVACNDDANVTTFGSAINTTLTAGINYYIQVAQFNGTLSGVPMDQVKSVSGVEELRTGDTIHVFRMVYLQTKTIRSAGVYDGFTVESSETSGVGQIKNSTLSYMRIGDDAKRRQYRSILAFNTSTLPSSAVITRASVRAKKSSVTAGNIFTQLGKLRMDIRTPYFGQRLGLEPNDFSAVASKNVAAIFGTTAILGWYRAYIPVASLRFINRTGYTQLRLRFYKDDNDDSIANYLMLYSGNAPFTNRPQLIIQYYVP